MYALTFQPWVGKSYHNGGIFGNENLFEYYCQNSKKSGKNCYKNVKILYYTCKMRFQRKKEKCIEKRINYKLWKIKMNK